MTAVITGDIVNSKEGAATEWQPLLKQALDRFGNEPGDWELFRGDSFQLQLSPPDALQAAIYIKASVRQLPNLDVRMGVGIGEQDYRADKITASTGPAFVRSGECFDGLKKQTLAIATSDSRLDEALNLMLTLALRTMDDWSETVAAVIVKALDNPGRNQQEIAELMGRSQSSISEALKRGGFDDVRLLEQYYRKHISSLWQL